MKPGRIVALIIALVVFAIPAVGMLIGGGLLTGGYLIERGDDGFFDETLDRLATGGAAIVTGDFDLRTDPGPPEWVLDRVDATVRIKADPADPGSALFVGIGRVADVDSYLSGVAHDEIDSVDSSGRVAYSRAPGANSAADPVAAGFWVASAAGPGPLNLEWDVSSGEWAAVLMNRDGSAGVTADVTVGIRSNAILAVGLALLAIGAFLAAAAVAVIVVSARGERPEPPAEAPPPAAGAPAPLLPAEPVTLTARLDEPLSPWMWLVKWFLAIPHLFVLAFLWIGVLVATIAAGFAVLFTGRYPRGIFEFNLGVMRWSWRVYFYAFEGGLATDRYPPFSLQREDDYPATLDIAYPERLSQGLVLVKWWLLALPHYLVLAFLIGLRVGPWWRDTWGSPEGLWASGLTFVFVMVAMVILLFTGRYPRPLFDLIIGINRWVFRVAAYVFLMTDRYPPFRLDQGGEEPTPAAAAPPPEVPVPVPPISR